MTEVKALEKKHAAMTIDREEEIASYHKLRQQLHGLEKEMQRYLQKPQYILPFLQPGRLIKVVHPALPAARPPHQGSASCPSCSPAASSR